MRRFKRWLGVLLSLAVLKTIWILAYSKPSSGDAEDRLLYLEDRLQHTSPGTSMTEGEWFLVSLSMTGLAEANLAYAHPETRADRLRHVEWLTERALASDARQFDTRPWGSDALQTLDSNEGHVGYLGHLGLLLGIECTLGGNQHQLQRQQVNQTLERRFLAARDGLIATYPKQFWVPDNAVALAAVAISDRCDGRAPPQVLSRWPIDPRTHVFQFTPHMGGRASGAGWNSIYLPLVDEQVASEQFAAAQDAFGWSHLDLAAWREYPHGVSGSGDSDSGPLVFGLSPAGTGFAIAGATRSDPALAAAMLRTAEAAGFSVPWGGRHYLLAPLVGEASVLAAKTAIAWH
jgi:hypothetical protein